MRIHAKGLAGGQVTFDGHFVTISKTGIAALAGGSGTKRIPARSISAVHIKRPGILTNGFIQFTFAGGNEVRGKWGRQTFDASADENSVVFTNKHYEQFLRIRDAIEFAMVS